MLIWGGLHAAVSMTKLSDGAALDSTERTASLSVSFRIVVVVWTVVFSSLCTVSAKCKFPATNFESVVTAAPAQDLAMVMVANDMQTTGYM